MREHPSRSSTSLVEILRWPAEAGRRGDLLDDGRRCLWVLPPGELPPELGPSEDWVRAPVDERDLHARVQRLAGRSASGLTLAPGEVTTDADGLLVRDGVRSVIPPIEARILDRLGATPDQVVTRAELIDLVWHDDRRSARAIDSRVHTLRGRLAPLHLMIHTIRGRGFLLAAEPPAPFESASGPATPRSDPWSNS